MEKNGKSGEKIILIEQLNTNGIVYESVNRFNNSIFSDVYYKATRLVETIVEKNDKFKNSIKMSSQNVRREIPNVISFIGRRGTGKTSSMLSFYEALINYSVDLKYKDKKILEFKEPFMESVKFEGIDCIDVAAMEDAEDIFILVLANMLNQVLNISKNQSVTLQEYSNRSLLQKFEKIYEDFMALKAIRNNENEGYSSFERLKNIASSQKVRSEFEDLVKTYLQTINEDETEFVRKKRFLIIVIDDLDMYQKKSCDTNENGINYGCYEIMRSIQQYLSVPNVIVLVAYNHTHLYDQCLEYFNYETSVDLAQIGVQENLYRNKELASQFMEKVFEVNARLYMPSWRKRDFDNENIIKIDINTKDENEILQSFYTKSREDKIITIKKFVLMLLGEKTGIYFDCQGLKKHFFEPDTFRSLYNTANFLMDMECCYNLVREKRELKYDICRDNIRQIKEDFSFHFAQEKLTDIHEKKLFDEWQMQVIDRRGSEIVNILKKTTVALGKAEKKKLWNLQGNTKNSVLPYELNNQNVKYSLAELVHSIYHMTRDEVYYTKELVACILFSFTLQLTDLYQCYRKEIKEISQNDYFLYDLENEKNYLYRNIQSKLDVFKNFIGNSVCGKWTQYYFPEIRIDYTGSIPADASIIGYREIKSLLFSVNYRYLEIAELRNQLNCIRNNEDENQKESKFLKVIYQILFIAMTQTDMLYWKKENIKCKITPPTPRTFNLTGEEKRVEKEFDISFEITRVFEENTGAIDLTGCFKYTIFYNELLKKIENLLLDAVDNIEINDNDDSSLKLVQIKDGIPICKELIKACFEKIWKEYYEWEIEYGNMMLPIYNLDITYNIIKRVFIECKRENLSEILIDNSSKSNIFLEEYEKMLMRFRKYLKEIDKYYCIEMDGFSATFEKSPFINMFNNLKDDKESCGVINRYIYSIAQDIVDNKKVMKTSD